jgi:hypothetical protein
MIADRECWERGCACHDTWNKGVEVVEKRTWVGLTDEEILGCLGPEAVRAPLGWKIVIGRVQAKLKEKNYG